MDSIDAESALLARELSCDFASVGIFCKDTNKSSASSIDAEIQMNKKSNKTVNRPKESRAFKIIFRKRSLSIEIYAIK